MQIYDLNQAYYLWEDIKEVIDRIGSLYTIEKINNQRFIKSTFEVPGKPCMISKESEIAFNKLIPKIKSLANPSCILHRSPVVQSLSISCFPPYSTRNRFATFQSFLLPQASQLPENLQLFAVLPCSTRQRSRLFYLLL